METGNYKVAGSFPKGFNVGMIVKALQEQADALQKDFAGAVDQDGTITNILQIFLEVTPPEPYQFTCIYCPNPVDVDNGQEICDTCLNEPAPTY